MGRTNSWRVTAERVTPLLAMAKTLRASPERTHNAPVHRSPAVLAAIALVVVATLLLLRSGCAAEPAPSRWAVAA